jgi:hypothetical protein
MSIVAQYNNDRSYVDSSVLGRINEWNSYELIYMYRIHYTVDVGKARLRRACCYEGLPCSLV